MREPRGAEDQAPATVGELEHTSCPVWVETESGVADEESSLTNVLGAGGARMSELMDSGSMSIVLVAVMSAVGATKVVLGS